jgi:hypothetical protein
MARLCCDVLRHPRSSRSQRTRRRIPPTRLTCFTPAVSCPLGTSRRPALWGTARFVPSRADDSQSPNAVGFGRPAGCGAAWLARLLWEQEAAGSNPAIPTSSERTSILAKIVCGPPWEPSVSVLNTADRKKRGYGEGSVYFDHASECRDCEHHGPA